MNDVEEQWMTGVPEWDPKIVTPDQPLWKTYKQTPTTKYGGVYEPYVFTEGRRRELERLPALDIVAPADFQLTEATFKPAWEKVTQIHETDLHELQLMGARESGREVLPELNVDLITATSGRSSWAMMASDRSFPEMLEFARHDISIGDYQRRLMLEENGMRIWKIEDGERTVFAVGEAQHHIMTAKILSFMGCEVNLRNIEVGKLNFQ